MSLPLDSAAIDLFGMREALAITKLQYILPTEVTVAIYNTSAPGSDAALWLETQLKKPNA